MIFKIDEVKIYFPYDSIYPEQLKYIREVKKNLDTGGHCLIEMPSGTGKTIALLSVTMSYMLHHKNSKKMKIVYCSRTVPEVDKAIKELDGLYAYMRQFTDFEFLGLGMSSRKMLCVNDDVLHTRNVDISCRKLVSEGSCMYYEGLKNDLRIESGVYDLDTLANMGKEQGFCPYYYVRNVLPSCDCIIYTYNYLVDPRIYGIVSKNLGKECVVIFDEAHNIDGHCIEALTFEIKRSVLEGAQKCLRNLSAAVEQRKKIHNKKLIDEYQSMKGTLKGYTEDTIPYFYSGEERDYEYVPGNMRDSIHFISILRRLIEFLKTKLKTTHVTTETPSLFCKNIFELTFIDKKTLRFLSQRLGILIQTVSFIDDDIMYLKRLADFGTMIGMYNKGFSVIFEPYDTQAQSVFNPVIRLACLDSSIAMSNIFSTFNNVIITSGTLSPIEMYPKILNFVPTRVAEIGATLDRNSISPLFITKGNDQMTIKSDDDVLDLNLKENRMTTSFALRSEPSIVRNYGLLVIELSKTVPDGVICFFPSYLYMEEIVSLWSENGIIEEIMKNKLVFVESPDFRETEMALSNYKRAVECGRGGVLFSVARGKVSEGVDFEDGYGRCVVIIGVPYQYTESVRLKKRLEYMKEEYGINEYEFLTFDAMRHAAQCLGRVFRNKNDYGLMVLADQRFEQRDKKGKLPKWINNYIEDGNSNLSVDMAMCIAKRYFREMAQGNVGDGCSLLSEDDVKKINIESL